MVIRELKTELRKALTDDSNVDSKQTWCLTST